MSTSYAASQFNASYSPKRLGNWEVRAPAALLPNQSRSSRAPSHLDAVSPSAHSSCSPPQVPAIREVRPQADHPAARGPTQFITGDNGHLLGKKKMTSFTTGYETNTPSPRWPMDKNTTVKYAGAATMGYKGIETTYLPTSTVMLQTNPGSPERTYH